MGGSCTQPASPLGPPEDLFLAPVFPGALPLFRPQGSLVVLAWSPSPQHRVLWFPPWPLPLATALAQPGPAAHQGAAEIAVSAPGGARKSACLLAE